MMAMRTVEWMVVELVGKLADMKAEMRVGQMVMPLDASTVPPLVEQWAA